jgi:hypothetical protein
MCNLNGLGYLTEVKLVWDRQTAEKLRASTYLIFYGRLSSIIISCFLDTYLLLIVISLSAAEPIKMADLL